MLRRLRPPACNPAPEQIINGGFKTRVCVKLFYRMLMGEGEPGLLLIKGPNVMKGYWDDPDKTAAAMKALWREGLAELQQVLED